MSGTNSKMSVWELMLLTAVNMIGAGIILLPASLAEVGGISVLSWGITTFCSTCLAYAFAKCGMYSTRPGGHEWLCGIYFWYSRQFPVLLCIHGIHSGIQRGHCSLSGWLWGDVSGHFPGGGSYLPVHHCGYLAYYRAKFQWCRHYRAHWWHYHLRGTDSRIYHCYSRMVFLFSIAIHS